jgi:hypothetical protein
MDLERRCREGSQGPACESGTLRGQFVLQVLHLGVEARLVVPKTTVRPSHSQGILLSVSTWNRSEGLDLRRVQCYDHVGDSVNSPVSSP